MEDSFFENQSNTERRRYVPYSFTMGLRKAMGHLRPENIQELDANRSFNSTRSDLSTSSGDALTGIFSGEEIIRKQFELSYDRGQNGDFPWQEIKSELGKPSTIYDLPVRHIVVRLDDEELENAWTEALVDAVAAEDFPTSWIEPPFFAVLRSAEPGDSDARENIKSIHDEFYYKPKFRVDEDHDGMDWELRSLDLESVWSYQGFVDRPETIVTLRGEGQNFQWTPREIEQYLMNYFHPEVDFTGYIRNSDFAGMWRRVYSRELTSTKEFGWEADQEWVQVDG